MRVASAASRRQGLIRRYLDERVDVASTRRGGRAKPARLDGDTFASRSDRAIQARTSRSVRTLNRAPADRAGQWNADSARASHRPGARSPEPQGPGPEARPANCRDHPGAGHWEPLWHRLPARSCAERPGAARAARTVRTFQRGHVFGLSALRSLVACARPQARRHGGESVRSEQHALDVSPQSGHGCGFSYSDIG